MSERHIYTKAPGEGEPCWCGHWHGSSADVQFDSVITKEIDAFDTPITEFSTQASPDGLTVGTGRWRVVHWCADKHTFINYKFPDTILCSGCGQGFQYEALGSQDAAPMMPGYVPEPCEDCPDG